MVYPLETLDIKILTKLQCAKVRVFNGFQNLKGDF